MAVIKKAKNPIHKQRAEKIAKSKTVLISIYVVIAALVGLFIFGDSGILDNMSQSQRIVALSGRILESQTEIDKMTEEYQKLSAMRTPNQAFLIDQGRKTSNIIIFQMNPFTVQDDVQDREPQRHLFLVISVIALLILFFGCVGIGVIHFYKNKKEGI